MIAGQNQPQIAKQSSPPIWTWVPANWAHQFLPPFVQLMAEFFPCPGDLTHWNSFTWNGLRFRNPLGAAGGFDKNAILTNGLERLGAGFHEVGTVTPVAQKQNPGQVVQRDMPNGNLWNKLGFPNCGATEMAAGLSNQKRSIPLFVNIGKNRQTPAALASQDYLACVRKLDEAADVFVINISSPNTSGLRDLQQKEQLASILQLVRKETKRPLLIKLSPDLSSPQLEDALATSVDNGASGFVLTNTTLQRPANCSFPKEGGLSGADLKPLSLRMLKEAVEILGNNKKNLLLISVGGVNCVEDVLERLSLGANLVQAYSSLALQGPRVFQNWLQKGRQL